MRRSRNWLIRGQSPVLHLRARCPQHWEEFLRECPSQIFHTDRAHGTGLAICGLDKLLTGAGLGSDHSLCHSDVIASPEREHLVVFDHGFTKHAKAVVAVLPIDPHDNSPLGWFILDLESAPFQQSHKTVPYRWSGQPLFEPFRRVWIAAKHIEILSILQAGREF